MTVPFGWNVMLSLFDVSELGVVVSSSVDAELIAEGTPKVSSDDGMPDPPVSGRVSTVVLQAVLGKLASATSVAQAILHAAFALPLLLWSIILICLAESSYWKVNACR